MSERTERRSTLEQLDKWLKTPMMLLSVVWLSFVALDLSTGKSFFLKR